MNSTKIAVKNLIRHKSRYLSLFIAISLGAGLSFTMSLLGAGLVETTRDKAIRYFSGDVTITGYQSFEQAVISHPLEIEKTLELFSNAYSNLVKRTILYNNDVNIFFNGETYQIRRLIGIEPKNEIKNFQNMEFKSGEFDLQNDNDIIISSMIAEKISVKIGDQVTIVLLNRNNNKNSHTFIVKGIFNESNIFGLVAYCNKKMLNRLVGLSAENYTDIGLKLIDPNQSFDILKSITEELKKHVPTFNLITAKSELSARLSETWIGAKYAVIGLKSHLTQIQDIIDSIQIIVKLILAFFSLVMGIGISNTLRLLIRERVKEIGTMRAIGLQKTSLIKIFVSEVGILISIALIIGIIFTIFLSWVIGSVKFPTDPVFSMFLNKGNLSSTPDFGQLLLTITIILIGSIIGIFSPLRNALKITPLQAITSK